MAEALVSLVLEQLGSILIQQVEAEVNLVGGVEEEVQKLTSNYRAIKAVIEDAEKRQVKENSVRDWLDKLQDTSYDIQDVLDQWSTAIRKLRMNKIENASMLKKKVRSLIPTYRFSPKQLVLRRDIASKIKDLNKTLDYISREKDMFSFCLMSSPREVERQITTSVIDVSQVHGRHQDKTELVDLLLTESSQGVPSLPIISIIGMGGIGKTTLARLAYHDDRVNGHFDKKIWVCVSDPFDEIRIARAILESLQGVAPNVAELETLLQHISQSIDTIKFLLVLDDVWTEDPNKWEQLKDSLNCGTQGSKILLTTRKKNVARMMRTSNIISVGKLSAEESWALFSQVAFSGRITKEYSDLQEIGKKIVNKCNGLPLAIKTTGSLMSLKAGFEQWQSVLDSEMWKLEEIEKGLFPPLLLSYYDLSSNLRKCFSYCAIFPKDYKIKKDLLIKLWMAQGYLKLEGREDMELIGEEYFENLAMRSFFQDFETDYEDGCIRSCKMHDVVHDFAQFLMKNESFTIEVVDLAVSQSEFAYVKARHLMMILKSNGSFPISICNEAKLHTLVIECYDHYLTSDILSKVFDKLRCLRTLDLDIIDTLGVFSPVDRIPKGIEKLIRLRHLGLKKFLYLKELPEALCDLYNLQTLDVSYCSGLRKLPQNIGKLINLRHLIAEGITLSYMPKGMERLTGLRSLRNFFVGNGIHGDKACTLECLKNLNNLRGSLALHGLGNMTNVDAVKRANLKSKNNIVHLRLSFDREEVRGRENVEHEVVLAALHPPPNLEKLTI